MATLIVGVAVAASVAVTAVTGGVRVLLLFRVAVGAVGAFGIIVGLLGFRVIVVVSARAAVVAIFAAFEPAVVRPAAGPVSAAALVARAVMIGGA